MQYTIDEENVGRCFRGPHQNYLRITGIVDGRYVAIGVSVGEWINVYRGTICRTDIGTPITSEEFDAAAREILAEAERRLFPASGERQA